MRVFYALTFKEKSKETLAFYKDDLANHALKGRFTRKENFHLTLEFIGDIRQSELHIYEEILEHLHTELKKLKVTHIGLFPKKNRAILWLGTEKNNELNRLNKNIRSLLDVYEIDYDKRKFHPHITVGRQVILDINTDDYMIKPFNIELDSIALMVSHRVKDILTYEPIYEIKL